MCDQRMMKSSSLTETNLYLLVVRHEMKYLNRPFRPDDIVGCPDKRRQFTTDYVHFDMSWRYNHNVKLTHDGVVAALLNRTMSSWKRFKFVDLIT